MGVNLHNDLNSLLSLLQSTQLSTKMDVRVWKLHCNGIFTVTPSIDILPGFKKWTIASDGLGLLKLLLKPRYTCGYHTMNIFLWRIFLTKGISFFTFVLALQCKPENCHTHFSSLPIHFGTLGSGEKSLSIILVTLLLCYIWGVWRLL